MFSIEWNELTGTRLVTEVHYLPRGKLVVEYNRVTGLYNQVRPLTGL